MVMEKKTVKHQNSHQTACSSDCNSATAPPLQGTTTPRPELRAQRPLPHPPTCHTFCFILEKGSVLVTSEHCVDAQAVFFSAFYIRSDSVTEVACESVCRCVPRLTPGLPASHGSRICKCPARSALPRSIGASKA